LLRVEFIGAMGILITKGFIFMEGLFSWKACGPCVIWEKGDIDWKENKKELWIISFFSKLDMVRKVVLGKKCVCDIKQREKRVWK